MDAPILNFLWDLPSMIVTVLLLPLMLLGFLLWSWSWSGCPGCTEQQ